MSENTTYDNFVDNAMLNVLHCIFSFETGGAETMLVDIINEQAKHVRGITLLIINNLIDKSLLAKITPKANIVRFEREPGANPLLLMLKLNQFINKLNPDIIHVHNHKLCPLIRIRRDRLLMTVHDLDTPMKYTRNIRMAAITDAVKSYVKDCHPKAKVRTILNGIHTADIPARESHSIPEVFKIVQVGRLSSLKKGQDILIDAVGLLNERGVTNLEVTFIGDGPDMEKLRNQAFDLGIGHRIHFKGLRDREYIYNHLRDYDAMCHPSRWEGFGLAIAEAMAAGLPILVTEKDGPWEVADNGHLCISFPNDNPEGCANAIDYLMQNYTQALQKAEEGQEFVRHHYDISRTAMLYVKLYNEIVQRKF